MSGVTIAIPVKNEEARIGACLDALARQTVPAKILLLLNDCSDSTAAICRGRAARGGDICLIECQLDPAMASAGEARRLALRHAAVLAGEGVILTTDADCRPPVDWVEKNLREIRKGADVVCGAAQVEEDDGLAGRLSFDLAREAMYAALIDEISAMSDPDPADPWPRHQQDSGASIAMRAPMLRAIGGAPRVQSGEDRALIAKFTLHDARIRHAPGIVVPVSGRLEGRAVGGMAEALARRAAALDEMTDAALEPAVDAYRRALARARLRGVRRSDLDGLALARDLLIHPAALSAALRAETFGAGWAAVQRLSPVLRRRRVKFAALARETRHAMALLEELKREAGAEAGPARGMGGIRAG